MGVQELLAEVRTRGVILKVEGTVIRYRPVDSMEPSLLAELKANKPQLLQLLTSGSLEGALAGGVETETITASEVCSMPLSVFATAGLVVEVHSRVLGEHVLFASDNALLDPGEPRPVYRASELEVLLGVSPSELRTIHRAKRIFGGRVEAN